MLKLFKKLFGAYSMTAKHLYLSSRDAIKETLLFTDQSWIAQLVFGNKELHGLRLGAG